MVHVKLPETVHSPAIHRRPFPTTKMIFITSTRAGIERVIETTRRLIIPPQPGLPCFPGIPAAALASSSSGARLAVNMCRFKVRV